MSSPTLSFSPSDIPDLTGKVALVTGANVGIGFETAYFLASHNATVYLACRSESRALSAIDILQSRLKAAKVDAKLYYHNLDLGSIKTAKSSADDFLTKETRLDILIANAGVLGNQWTLEWEYEPMFYTNHLGHFAFVTTLLPLIEKTASLTHDVRIVCTTSKALTMTSPTIDYNSITERPKDADEPRHIGQFATSMKVYGQGKLANLYFAKELDRRYREKGVWVNAPHPGWVGGTELGLHEAFDMFGFITKRIVNFLHNWVAMKTADGMRPRTFDLYVLLLKDEGMVLMQKLCLGAATQTYLATSPHVPEYGIHGQYLMPRKNWLWRYQGPQVVNLGAPYQNEEEWSKLWQWSEEVVKKELAK
ncbi:hypothetical protein TWF106_000459 [Orbilia oligospora]|uniref:NAD(P)-binding protein n=1 Tax=Orbilia oligospora TaxID=2813651 RepID=A0A7C8UPP2_ORBOL|nr:hypothetical protein TWF106_000459 [Orbilia oligospora]